jgi:hypothetical protein
MVKQSVLSVAQAASLRSIEDCTSRGVTQYYVQRSDSFSMLHMLRQPQAGSLRYIAVKIHLTKLG